MNTKKRLIIVLLCIGILSIGIYFFLYTRDEQQNVSVGNTAEKISVSANTGANTQDTLFGGVVAHHDFVAHEIDRFWKEAATRIQPATIILIGPDHTDTGKAQLTTTANPQMLSGMNLATDTITTIMQQGIAAQNDELFLNEHSVRLHIPYIRKYFSQVEVIPLLARSDMENGELKKRVERIRSLTQGTIFVVASIDFSHYETVKDAEQFDIETWNAIQAYDYLKLQTFGPEHMDSEQSLIFMTEFVCPQHTCTWEQFYHGNSANYSGADSFSTTSYFSLFLSE